MIEPRTKRAEGLRPGWAALVACLAACSVVDDPLPSGAGAGGSGPGGNGQAQNNASSGGGAQGSQPNGGRDGSGQASLGNAGTIASGAAGSANDPGSGEPGGGAAGDGSGGGGGDAGNAGSDPDPAGGGGASGGDAAGSGSAGSGAAGTDAVDDRCESHEDCVLCTTPISDALPCCDGCPVVMSAKRCAAITAARESCAQDRIAICPIPLCVFPGQPLCEANLCVAGEGLAQ